MFVLVQTKHAECLHYHAEIQRLCAELTKVEKQRTSTAEQFEKQLEVTNCFKF